MARWRWVAVARGSIDGTVVRLVAAVVALYGAGLVAGPAETARGGAAAGAEVLELRTPTSATYGAGNGRKRTVIETQAIHFASDHGLERVATALGPLDAAAGIQGYAFGNRANGFRTLFKPSLARGFLRVATGGSAVDVSLEDAAPVLGALTSAGVRYGNALADTDLEYAGTAAGVKEVLTLRSQAAPATLRFRFDPLPGRRLEAARLASGALRLTLDDGEAVTIEPPYAVDARADRGPGAAGAPAADRSPHMTMTHRASGAGYVVELRVDEAWLRSPRRRFPVVIDPSLTLQSAATRAEFPQCSGCVGVDRGDWRVGSDGSTAYRSAFRFDFSAIPAGARVVSARFDLPGNCLKVGTTCPSIQQVLNLHRLNSSWAPGTASSALQFDADPIDSYTTIGNAPSQTASWSRVSSLVADWIAGTARNDGFLVKAASEGLGRGGLWSGTARLEVVWSDQAAQLAEPVTLHANGAELEWRKPGAFLGGAFDRYEVHRSLTAGFTPSAQTLIATIRDPDATTFRDTTAAPDKWFSYKVLANGQTSVERRVRLPATGFAETTVTTASSGGADTFLVEGSCANHGGSTELEVASGPIRRRALLRFELPTILRDAEIATADLKLFVTGTTGTQSAILPSVMRTAWNEGYGRYGACFPVGATWAESDAGQPWQTAGGDAQGVGGYYFIPSSGTGWTGLGVQAEVSDWVREGPNLGLMLKYNTESGSETVMRFAAGDGTPDRAPRLRLRWHENAPVGKPAVAVTAPEPDAMERGAVALKAEAADDQRIDRVEFRVDGAVLSSDTSAPYEATWSTAAAQNGQHEVTARAIDDAGNETTSDPVQFRVGNSQAPTAAITSHADRYDVLVKQDRPAAYWRLDETAGTTAVDASGNGWSGTYAGSYLLGTAPLITGSGSSATFKNAVTDGRMSASAGYLAGPMTAEAWYDSAGVATSGAYNRLVSRGWGASGGWMLALHKAGPGYPLAVWSINKGGTIYSAQAVLTSGRHHIAGTYDGNVARLFLNGAESASATVGPVTLTAGGSVHVGETLDTDTVVDEVAVYERALSQQALARHHELGTNGRLKVGGDVPVTAAATDDGTVQKVEFLLDGSLIAEDTAAPFETTLRTLDQAAPIYDGRHAIVARAYDNHEQYTESAPVEVDVANASDQYRARIEELTATPETVEYDPARGSDQLDHGIDVRVTNTSSATWAASDVVLRPVWRSPDPEGTDVPGAAVPLPAALAPGQSVDRTVTVEAPALPPGIERARYKLEIDAQRAATGQAFGPKGNKPHVEPVNVDKATTVEQGLERYYQYDGEDVGAGMVHLLNVASGNSLLRWTPFEAPGRGLSTVVDLTYNALEQKSESPVGNNFSLAISGLTRFGNPIDIHPNDADRKGGRPESKYVEIVDGDGTLHRFNGRTAPDGSTYYEEPPGVNLYLRALPVGDPNGRWAFTRPDRVTFYYDADGYPLSVADANGNRITYTLENTPPGEDPGGPKKRITRVTDAGGRSFTIAYYSKADAKQAHVRGNIARISDHDGKGSLAFEYYKDGNLHRLIQRGGPRPDGRLVPDRSFTFTYTTSAGNGPATNTNAQSTRIYSVRDPRGGETRFSYLGSGHGNDRWKLESRTDRSSALTSYTYDTATRLTTVSAPEARVTKYRYDAMGQPTAITNPLNETTTLTWTPDRQVSDVVEPGAGDVPQRSQHYEYNANGYLTKAVDEENETTELTYENFPAAPGDPGTHVSDLKTVKNPRGFTHTYFYDENQPYTGRRGNVSKVVDPLGHATEFRYNLDGTVAYTEDQRDKRTTIPEYDLNGLPRQVVDATNRAVRFSHDADGRLEWVQDAVHGSFPATGGCGLHGARERDWRTCLDYDAFGRLVRVSEPKSTEHARGQLLWSSAVHDPNDNVVETEAPHLGREDTRGPSISTAGFDAMDRVRFEVGPDRSAGEERVTYDYDTAGRMTKVTSPRGTQTAAANDFATTLTYDKLDRVVMDTRERTDPGRLATLRTHYCYDIAGDLRSITRPRAQVAPPMTCAPGAPAGTSHTWRYRYYADGQLERAIDPLGHFKRWTYDANDNVDEAFDKAGTPTKRHYNNRDEVVQLDRMLTAGKTVSTKFEYDPAGNLLKKLTPRAVDTGSTTNYVTSFAYDDANRLIRTIMPVGPNSRGSADPVQAAYEYRQYDPNGRVAMVSLPSTATTVDGLTDNEKTQATYWDPGWVRTTNAPGAPRQSYDYTPEGWQAKRRAEGKDGGWREMEWTYFLDGTLQRQEGQTNEEDLSFNQYTYDLNNNVRTALISVGAHDPEGEPRDLTVEWDTLDELSKVVETPRNRVDLYEHDLNGNLSARVDDAILGQEGTTGHRHEYTYDGRDKMDFHLDLGRKRGDPADDRDVDVEYAPTGWVASRAVRSREAGVMRGRQRMEWTYFLNGLKKTVETRKGSDPTSEVVESHTLSYLEGDDYLNGHRVTDTFKVLGPDATAKCRTTTCTRTYTYDARDRVVAEDRTEGPSASYSFDAPGNLESKTIDGQTVRFRYEGTQVTEMLTASHELVARYRHDAFGNLDCVTNHDVALADMGSVCDDSDEASPHSGLLQRNRYDALDRLRLGQRFAGGQLKSRSRYAYDPLNRPIRRDERSTDPQSEKTGTRRFQYVGLSRSVSRETWNPDGDDAVVKEYSYDADGTRVAFTAQRGSGSVRELTYGYNAHGDVSLVLDGNGTAKASYGYLAFGDEDKGLTKEKEFDGEADAKPNNPTNAYRYTGKSLDPDTGTLDMGARRFSPEIGGFLQADQFDDALSNLGLSTDPLTANRYSLAAGNPVSFVEVDGHIPIYDNVEEAKQGAETMREFGKAQMERSNVPASGPGRGVGNAHAQEREIEGKMEPYRLHWEIPFDPHNPKYNIGATEEPDALTTAFSCGLNEFTAGATPTVGDTSTPLCLAARIGMAANPKGALQRLGKEGIEQATKEGAEQGAKQAAKSERGGLNLYKWNDPTSTRASGWREGDRMLTVPWRGTPKATWKENASRLRREMRSGDPIYETYVDDAGNLLPAGGPGNPGQFLRAERNLLTNHGWTYHPRRRAWVPPSP